MQWCRGVARKACLPGYAVPTVHRRLPILDRQQLLDILYAADMPPPPLAPGPSIGTLQ